MARRWAEAGAGAAAVHGGRRPALATLTAVLFLTFLDTTIVAVALADVQSSLHAGVSQLQWVVNGYALTFAALMLAMGTLGDRLGRKRVMLGGLGVFIGGSLFGALAPTVSTLVAARVDHGRGRRRQRAGHAVDHPPPLPRARPRARALGAWAAVAGLALAMGPVIGGVLVGLGGWRARVLVQPRRRPARPAGRARHRARERRPAGGPHRHRRLRARPARARHGDLRRHPRRDHRLPRPRRRRPVRRERRGGRARSSLVEQRSPSSDLRPRLPAAGAVHRLADGRLRRLLRHLLDLLLHGALPAGRGRLLRLPHGRPVRAHGGRHDRRLGADRALGGPRRAAPADRARLPCRRRRRAAHRRGAARPRRASPRSPSRSPWPAWASASPSCRSPRSRSRSCRPSTPAWPPEPPRRAASWARSWAWPSWARSSTAI